MTDREDKPPFDWLGQIQYLLLIVAGTIAVLMLLRYFGLRG
jgi:hypothetical protein